MAMTIFEETYVGATLYPLKFDLGYIDKSHVYVYSGEASEYTSELNYEWSDDNTIQLVSPFPDVNTGFYIRRVVPRDDLIAYFNATRLQPGVLDNLHLQLLMIAQELSDGFGGDNAGGGLAVQGILDMAGYRISNLGAPTEDDDAIRLIDLTGGLSESRGIQFQSDDAYMDLATALPIPTDGSSNLLTLGLLLHSTVYSKTLALASDGTVLGLNADNSLLYMLDADGQLVTLDISAMALPSDTEIVLVIETKNEADVLSIQLRYGDVESGWQTWGSSYEWLRFFGGASMDTGVGITVYTMKYQYDGLTNEWDFSNQQGTAVVSTYSSYVGTLSSGSWENTDSEQVTIPLNVTAEDVAYTPYGTNYPETANTVEKVLANIDTQFVRAGSVVTDADDVDGTVLSTYRTWLADTSTPRTRPLPAEPVDGDWVVIRDDTGTIVNSLDEVENLLTIERNGNTIMGLEEDLTMTTNWSWVKLMWLEELNDWRVTEGGVGAQVRVTPLDVSERMYPVDHVIFTMNPLNPANYLQFGTWRQVAVGQFIMGIGSFADANNVTRTTAAGENTGEWEHTQTLDELVNHTHDTNSSGGSTSSSNKTSLRNEGGTDSTPSSAVQAVGGGNAMNVTSPGYGMYAFQRIA